MNELEKNNKNEYNNSYYVKIALSILLIAITVIVLAVCLIKFLIAPNFKALIQWFVPNFWSLFGYFIIIFVIYKICSFFWSPIRSLLGKWSYLIIAATIFYILIQINVL